MSELIKELHLQISIARMMPIKILTDRIARLIDNLAAAAGKEVAFRVVGEDIEMDRAIIEGIEEPLLHVVRNAIDHGIETPQERENKNKPREGMITLTISKTKDNILIQVEDDGSGIKSDLIKQKAVEKGLLTQEEAENMAPEDALMLICSPGFSTAKEITKTSGRGVGINIIKKKIEALGGSITISSQEGVGSRFVFSLPLTVSIMPAFIVRISNYFFAIPITKVVSNVKILPEEISFQKQKECFTFRNTITPLFQLNKLLKIDTPIQTDEGYLAVVIVEIRNRSVGLIVDEFVGQQEVVIRPLTPPLHNITVFSGITLLGNGQITLVLNLEELEI
jgi:two-component system chemotaxis sensor kinase CheA